MNIDHFFYADQSIYLSRLLISAKINSSNGDTVLFLIVKDVNILVYEYFYTDLGYQIIRKDTVTVPAEAESWVEIQKLIFRDKKTVSSESVQHSLNISKYVQDRTYTKYHVIPTCAKKYGIHDIDDVKKDTYPLYAVDVGDKLPIHFECYLQRSVDRFCITGFDESGENEKLIFETVQEINNRHRSKITVTIDPESFPILVVRPVIIDIIYNLPAFLDENHAEKLPVIGFCDNFSVICVYKENEEKYYFVEGWNGLYGQNLCISFDEEKPKFGFEALKSKPSSVVN
uniref:Uncharacterized protein n=1 Tax=Panagrolaimus sp. ES5 TaxID=591445 RepID=A0AC34GCR4_9BILA